jgi:hypothetical protein
MTTPRYHHTWSDSDSQPPAPTVPQATLDHLKVKAAVGEVRSLEARRRNADLQQQLDHMGARVADLEHPAQPDSDTNQPSPTVVANTSRGPTVEGPADRAWIIDGWRDQGWTP